MLRIVEKPRFSAQVAVDTPQVQGEFRVDYVGLPQNELRSLEVRAKTEAPELGVLPWVVTGFEPVQLPDGTVVQFEGAQSLQQLTNWPGIVPSMIARYYERLWESALGNSERLPVGSSDPLTQQPTEASATTPTLPTR